MGQIRWAGLAMSALLSGAVLAPQTAAAQAPPAVAADKAQTVKIVAAANAFLATLDDAQKKTASFAFTDTAQRARWSNFPPVAFQRAGLRWGDMTAPQRAALWRLVGAVLSPQGLQMVREQMDADNALKADPASGAPQGNPFAGAGGGGPPPGMGGPPGGGRPPGGGPGGGDPGFGEDNYRVAILGAPSATAPWMLQFGGHHLGINATVAGARLTLSPSLTGGQPVKFIKDGKTVYIVEREVDAANALMTSLTAAQKAKAVRSAQLVDLVLGPGHDGQTLQPEGLPASEMTADQKARLLSLIEARIGIVNPAESALTMAEIRKGIDQTWLAWFGPADAGQAYFRIVGPSLILEFSPQDTKTPSNHYHNMYRNPGNEYGAGWVKP